MRFWPALAAVPVLAVAGLLALLGAGGAHGQDAGSVSNYRLASGDVNGDQVVLAPFHVRGRVDTE